MNLNPSSARQTMLVPDDTRIFFSARMKVKVKMKVLRDLKRLKTQDSRG